MLNELIKSMAGVRIASKARSLSILPSASRVTVAPHCSRLRELGGPISLRPTWPVLLQHSSFSSESTAVQEAVKPVSPTMATVVTDESTGKQYGMLIDTRNLPKLKPSVVQRRLAMCKTYVGKEKGIRQSPWKLNRICQLAAGLTLEEALTQLKFCPMKNSDLVAKVLKRTSNLADIRDGIQMSQLEVAECFATKGLMLKRIKPMGRGRHGVMHHKFSHIRVVLREIDFPLKIFQQKSLNQKQKWLKHQQRAEKDAQAAKAKREEMQRLMRQQEEQLEERKSATKKS